MKDYSEMSDYEIDKAVAKIVSTDSYVESYDENRVLIHDYHNGVCLGWKTFNPCNNPSDMWPLIVENRIWIQPDMVGDGYWHCHNEDLWSKDKNPLRAAAIVFLMLNED